MWFRSENAFYKVYSEADQMSARAKVYFSLKGDDFDPDEITKELGVIPTSKYKTGDPGRYKLDCAPLTGEKI